MILLSWYRKWRDRDTQRMFDEFIKTFPDKCIVCSYHRFGRDNGLTSQPKPDDHKCIDVPISEAKG
jgi:hypothetical protein